MPEINPLFQVVTIQEAANLFFVHPDTLMYHIHRGNIQARKAGSKLRGVWLISTQSLIDLYGQNYLASGVQGKEKIGFNTTY